MKKCLFFLLFILLLLLPLNTYANEDDVRKAISKYDNIEMCDTHIIVRGDYAIELFGEMMQITSDLYRGCSLNETNIKYVTTKNGLSLMVPLNQYLALEAEQNYIDKWVAEVVPTIVPNGSTGDETLDNLYDYIINNYTYDINLISKKEYQGAKAMIENKKGLCASFARLYRSMVEYVPFNESSVVDYENGTTHFKVAIVYSDVNPIDAHEWCAVRANGSYWEFDPATDARCHTRNLTRMKNYRFPGSHGYVVWQY